MKRNEIKELHSKTIEELRGLLKEARAEEAKLRLELSTKKLKNTRQLFFQRKKIARLLTVVGQKEMAHA